MRGGDRHVPFLGPSFFTKFLYFVSGPTPAPGGEALILDRYVALGLNCLLGWSLGESGPWSPDIYGEYLDWVRTQMRSRSKGASAVSMASYELALFRLGQQVDQNKNGRGARGSDRE
jgi:hypothetical protein